MVRTCKPVAGYKPRNMFWVIINTIRELFLMRGAYWMFQFFEDMIGEMDGNRLLPTCMMFSMPIRNRRRHLSVIKVAPIRTRYVWDIMEEIPAEYFINIYLIGNKAYCRRRGVYTEDEWRIIIDFIERHAEIIKTYQKNEMTLELFEFELFEAELKYRHDAGLLKLDMSEYRKHINYSYLKRYSTDEHIAHANISHRRRAELDERRRIYGYNTHDEEETLFYHAEKFYRKTRLLRKSDRSDIYPGHQILDYDYIFMPFAIKPIMDDTEDGTPVVGVRLPKNKNEYDWVTVTLDDNPKWIGDNVDIVHDLRKKSKHFAEALDFTLDVIKETKETLIEHRTDKISGSEVADFINDCIKRRIYAGEYPNVKITEKMKSLWDPE